MMQTLINTPNLRVTLRTGSEGPKHDPYHYDEYEFKTPAGLAYIHDGLARYLRIGSKRIELNSERCSDPMVLEQYAKMICGYTLTQIRRFAERRKARCPKGGAHQLRSMPGMPGETFAVCTKCDDVVDSYFNLSEVA